MRLMREGFCWRGFVLSGWEGLWLRLHVNRYTVGRYMEIVKSRAGLLQCECCRFTMRFDGGRFAEISPMGGVGGYIGRYLGGTFSSAYVRSTVYLAEWVWCACRGRHSV